MTARRWFAPIPLMLAIATVCFIGVIAVYVAHFGYRLSPEHRRWGEFGEYVGGFLGPVFSFGALVGVLWTIQLQIRASDDARRQQVENTFFHLLERFARIKATATYYTGSQPPEVWAVAPIQLTQEAWQAWKSMMNERTETTEAGARDHLSEVASRLIKSKYNNITLITDELLRLYAYVYRAKIRDGEKALYVQFINGEASPIERTLLMVTLFNQPKDGAAFAVVNSLGVFSSIDLATSFKIPAEVYRKVLSQTYPHLPQEGGRPVVSL